MKKLFSVALLSIVAIHLYSAELLLIPNKNFDETIQLFENPDIKVHFYRDEFVIATNYGQTANDHIVLDEKPWKENISYYIVYTDLSVNKVEYKSLIENRADVLYEEETFLIVSSDETIFGQLPPAKNDGMVRIFEREAKLPQPQQFLLNFKVIEPDAFIIELLDKVDASNITNRVQHLELYGTRDAYTSQSVVAQEWIENQFIGWGLDVEVMSFTMPGGPSSDNVIATLTGTTYPEQYVVLGGHYDSRSNSAVAPGADDNASGTSGVMEIARILSEYEFERTIIFCAFSGEEYGLYGSAAYANRCVNYGMNILGYFNMDMIGYLKPGNTTIKSSLIYPSSAKPLADFYTEVASVYLPDFEISPASLTGGDSDHTSFNNNGYMGIFPFEDINNYSPYIHTSNDLVGPSYNNENQAVVFTQAVLAAVVTMAHYETNVGISEIKNRAKLYPNPTSGELYISISDGQKVNVTVSNIEGQKVLEFFMTESAVVGMSDLPAGLYLIHIEGNDFREVHKVIVQ
jgi:hypothetical protein